MKANLDVAAGFLLRLYPRGPWHLTAIAPKDGKIVARFFAPGQIEAAKSWIAEHNAAGKNIYYSVNLPLRPVNKKLEREDIDEVHFLHVDVDPREREDHESERARILGALSNPPDGIPRPTVIVYSGGGYNALWRLDAPIEIRGEMARYEEAKLYNVQLEHKLGGDHCHNVDRILRVPGTVNYPNARKIAKGRTEYLAEVVFFEDTSYPISAFVAAQPVQVRGEPTTFSNATTRVKVSGNVKRLDSVDDLPPSVDQRTKMLIVQGCDPDDPTAYTSRSELLYRVCCGLVRGGCDDDTIYAVITDESWPIATSVLEKGTGAERYALRQIERAREEAESKDLALLNARYAVIGNMGGRCRIVEDVEDHSVKPPRRRLTKQSFDDFRNRYMHVRVDTGMVDKQGNPIMEEMGKWWLKHRMRRQFDSLIFAPGREVPNAYNLWRGFNYEPKPGTGHESFLRHVRENLCDDNPVHYEYVIRWMARAVQRPAETGEVAVVFRGRMGTGKGMFARHFGRLWGRHYLQVTNAQHLVGQFNAHLRDAVVLFADEAFFAGDKRHASILKAVITEENFMLEAKGIDAESWPNYLHIIMATNERWAVPAGHDERRYLVLDVNPAKIQNTPYFHAMTSDLEGGGYENLLHFLLHLDISDYDHRKVPVTKALLEQKQMSLASEEEWWFSKLLDGQILRDAISWDGEILKDALVDDYLEYARNVGTPRRATASMLGRFLHKATPKDALEEFQRMHKYTDATGRECRGRRRFYKFPGLDECRAWWDAEFGGPGEWPAIDFRGEEDGRDPF